MESTKIFALTFCSHVKDCSLHMVGVRVASEGLVDFHQTYKMTDRLLIYISRVLTVSYFVSSSLFFFMFSQYQDIDANIYTVHIST